MAIEKVMARRTLGISVKDGMNADGTDKLKTYSYSKLKDTAADVDVLAVGKALGSLMNSEVFLKYGQKPFRADILVFDRKGEPLLLVECKRPDVLIDEQVLRQALNYHAVLNISFLVLTNGKTTYLYGRNKGGEFESLSSFPKYEEMLCR